jgi:Transcription factor S-II (TFIIS), central domain
LELNFGFPQEQLTNRLIQDTAIMRMSPEDITKFAHQTEKEMYLFFSRDTGVKYKAKYRSLVFNIKDAKNQTLIKKIADKSIRPYDLVSGSRYFRSSLAQKRQYAS